MSIAGDLNATDDLVVRDESTSRKKLTFSEAAAMDLDKCKWSSVVVMIAATPSKKSNETLEMAIM
jgi:hypothetical protein